jgi:hypothetical protein
MKLLTQLSVEKLEPDQEHVIAKTKDLALMVTKEITSQIKSPFIVNGLTYLIYPPATLENSPLAHLPREVVNLPCGGSCVVCLVTALKGLKRKIKSKKTNAIYSWQIESDTSVEKINAAKMKNAIRQRR